MAVLVGIQLWQSKNCCIISERT